MAYLFWKKKVSPLQQINAEQLRNLTQCCIKYCEHHGNKIHSGTFILCTGNTNLLETVEQTLTGKRTIKQRIVVPFNDQDYEYPRRNNHGEKMEALICNEDHA